MELGIEGERKRLTWREESQFYLSLSLHTHREKGEREKGDFPIPPTNPERNREIWKKKSDLFYVFVENSR